MYGQTAIKLIGEKNDGLVKAHRCGYCPSVIIARYEPKGRLHIYQGRPVCVKCRVLSGKKRRDILADRKKYKQDQQERDDLAHENEKKKVQTIAAASQARAGV